MNDRCSESATYRAFGKLCERHMNAPIVADLIKSLHSIVKSLRKLGVNYDVRTVDRDNLNYSSQEDSDATDNDEDDNEDEETHED